MLSSFVFPLAWLDTPCYILNRFGSATRRVSGRNSESRMTMQQERWLSVDEIAAHTCRAGALREGGFKATEVDEWV